MSARIWLMAAAGLLLSGCVVPGGGGYAGADYYESYDGGYGGWGPGYRVGPFRGEQPYLGGGLGHGWRGPAGGRGIPSIPGGMRGGGFGGGRGFGGGARGGGGGGRGGGGGGHGR